VKAEVKGLSLKTPLQAAMPLQRPGPMSLLSPKGSLDRGSL